MIIEQIENLHRQLKFNEELELLNSLSNLTPELKARKVEVMCSVALAADPYPRDLKIKLFEETLDFAQQLINENHDVLIHVRAHQMYIYALAQKGLLEGRIVAASYFKEMLEHMNIAMSLNPNDPDNHHIIGCTAYELASLNWVERSILRTVFGISTEGETYDKAIQCLLKAEQLYIESNLSNKYRLAMCYEAQKRKSEARKLLDQVIGMEPVTQLDIISKKEAIALRYKI